MKAGEFIGIVGPSGSGKSTLLSIAGALLSPSKGDIYIREQNITQLSEKEMTDIRLKNRLHFPVCKPCSIFKCERTVTLHCKAKKKVNKNPKSVRSFISGIWIRERKNHYPNQLSGGENKG